MSNPPFRRPFLHRRDATQRKEIDPLHAVGYEAAPSGPGIISDDDRLNVPDEKDFPGSRPQERADREAGPYGLRTKRPEIGTHLPPVYDNGGNTTKTDLIGNVRVNNATGGRVNEDSGSASITAANQAVQVRFLHIVNHLIVQNNSASDIKIEFDSVASQGSLTIVAGAYWSGDIHCQNVWLWCAAAVNINGGSAANVVVIGFN